MMQTEIESVGQSVSGVGYVWILAYSVLSDLYLSLHKKFSESIGNLKQVVKVT